MFYFCIFSNKFDLFQETCFIINKYKLTIWNNAINCARKDLSAQLNQVYYYTLFTYEQNITTIVSRLFTVNTDTIQMQKLFK